MTEPNGVLLVDKPQDFTSHDVVAKLRGILHTKKIGHGGTLDPQATGVLPLFIGGATKAADLIIEGDKRYLAGFALGFATDTQDSTGKTLETRDKTATKDEITAVCAAFLGEQQQLPPMYSAVKVDGKKLYELARQGKEIVRKPREITVFSADLIEFDEKAQRGTIDFRVSRGTYIRTLLDDIGRRLGTLATMTALRRTAAGEFTIDRCHTLEQIQKAADSGRLSEMLLSVDCLFAHLPAVRVNAEGQDRLSRGATAFARMTDGLAAEGLCRVYDRTAKFLMIGKIQTLNSGGLGLFVHKNLR